ncbi:fumarylacetoacetase [Segeticoccus rhizosphaerae]|uniref:fumarylacetoacetase n=1 Tax=Segeticoccus rhizosphaerae TaxID=1104777 RepID=UPI001264E4E7|nr:fumarylacetoacetase [Segeticoccus rhizosphaerae]
MTTSWLDLPADHPFGINTLPYGVFSPTGGERRVGVRIGDRVLDAGAVAAIGREKVGVGEGPDLAAVWQTPSLNAFLSLGHEAWRTARAWLTEILTDEVHREAVEPHLHDLAEVTLHLPIQVADYVDFYASEQHATNLGKVMRPGEAPLKPNWKHLPVGYHGRAGTVVVSGTDIIRPAGQRKAPADEAPTFGPSSRLDIETELGFVVGGATPMGTRVTVDDAPDHLFGVTLFNDWSARDIQGWEQVPLGPNLGKSFGSSAGAWVVPMAALEAARVALPVQDPEPLPYLRGTDGPGRGIDLRLEVRLNKTVISRPPYNLIYWSPEQMVAHMTVNGASLRDGDLFASGTISGENADERGSLIEMTVNATEPITLSDGSTRGFLEDGDTVTITGWAPGPDGTRIGLGEVTGTIKPAR